MSADENAALVRRYFTECVSGVSRPDHGRALAVVDELLSPDFVMRYNTQTESDAMRGRERHKEFLINHG